MLNAKEMELAFDLLQSMAKSGSWETAKHYGNLCEHLADMMFDSEEIDPDMGNPALGPEQGYY